jgi:hypothetical protein
VINPGQIVLFFFRTIRAGQPSVHKPSLSIPNRNRPFPTKAAPPANLLSRKRLRRSKMFCSFKVEPKNSASSFTSEDPSPSKISKFRSEWEQVVESASSQWLKDRPHIPIARNVGGTRKNKWTPIEDQMLDAAVVQFGQDNWRRVALLVPGRSSKQCRERWMGHMAPDNTKEEWSAQEDMLLVEKQGQMGNQWAKIKEFLPGRSLIAVKNRWNWLCRRDIPNHSQEFGEIVKAQMKPEFEMDEPWIGDARASQLEVMGEQWPFDLVF